MVHIVISVMVSLWYGIGFAPFLCIYEGPCNIGASFKVPQIEQYICLPIGSCLVEDCGAIVKQWPEEHLLQEREPLPNVEHLPNLDPVLSSSTDLLAN